MRLLLTTLAVIFSFVFAAVISVVLLLFFKPEILINTKTLKYVLDKTGILESWSWDKGQMNVSWKAWNDRRFEGEFKNFCFEYISPGMDATSCLNEVSWNLRLHWTLKQGLEVETINPVVVKTKELTLVTRKEPQKKEKGGPPPVWDYWSMLWAGWFPDLNINASEIILVSENETRKLDLKILKDNKRLQVEMMGFQLKARPEKIEITGPPDLRLPEKIKLKKPLELRNTRLTAQMKKDGIPLRLTAQLEGVEIDVDSYIDLPLRSEFSALPFRKDLFLNTNVKVLVQNLKKVVHSYVPHPYDKLPAPLNVMNGQIDFLLETEKTAQKDHVLLKTLTNINLEGKKQVIDLSITGNVPVNVMDFSRGLIDVGIDFSEVSLQLPRLSKKEPPPQFFPDNRFKEKKTDRASASEKKTKLSLDLEAMNKQALHIRSNLLDEPLRLNFDLEIRGSEIKDGYLKVLPLKTKVFKRPVRIRNLVVRFEAPLEPVIESTIQFPLPEYKITLKLEGPLSNPRHSFSSEPPLPQNDIYAVLLFGRPLSELNPDDKNAARQTNKLLAQGILSLSVLYFLAGSPVEYIGYDPETGRATAQFGIDRKTSLNVAAGKGGSSTGVRRSLGKGWYLDTSVQKTSDPANEGARDYGVLLERIIAY